MKCRSFIFSSVEISVNDQTFKLTPDMVAVKKYQKKFHGKLKLTPNELTGCLSVYYTSGNKV